MEEAVNTATEKTQAMFADANDRAQGVAAKGTQMFEEMNAFGKGNVEALVESSRIAAKGYEALAQEAVAQVKRSYEEATAAMKTLAAVKSPAEFMKLHGDFVRQSFDTAVAQASRSTEAQLKLAGEIVQPIQNRLALAAEKIKVGG